MRQLLKRPLAFGGISFYIVSFLLVRAGTGVKTAVIIAASVILVSLVTASCISVRYRGVLSALSLVFVFILFASALSYYAYDIKPARFSFADGEAHRITAEAGEVYSSSSYGSAQSFTVASVDGNEASLRILVETDGESVNPGDLAEFDTTLSPLGSEYSGIEYRSYLADGIMFCASPQSMKVSDNPHPSLSSLALRLSSRLGGILCSALGYRSGGFASAILLGDKSFLETGVKHDFARLGISHLLAISGLHLTIIAVYLSSLIKRLTGSETAGEAAKIVISASYSILAGLSMSVVRAAVMLTVASVARIISRRSDMATSLGVAVFGIVLFDPYAAGSISLLFSFASIIGIIFCSSALRDHDGKHGKVMGKVISSLIVSASVFAVTLPVSWLYSDEISVVSPLSNLLFIPLVSLVLTLLPVLLILSPVTKLYVLAAKPVSALISAVLDLAEYFGRLRGVTVSTAVPLFPAVAAVIIGALVLSAFVEKKKRKYCAFAVAAAIAVLFASVAIMRTLSSDCTAIVMTAHKSNDEFVVISDNKTLLIDVSDGSFSSVLPAIDAMHGATYCELDALMLTHLHSRHTATVRKLMRQMRIGTLILPLPISDTDAGVYESLSLIAESAGCEVVSYDRQSPEDIPFASCVISPTEYVTLSRSSHPVITFSVIADKTFAYLGGASNEPGLSGVTDLLSSADVLCFGAHSPVYKLPLIIGDAYYNAALSSVGTVSVSGSAVPFSEEISVKIRLSGK